MDTTHTDTNVAAVVADKLFLTYAKKERLFLALNSLTIHIPQGCVYCLIGPSGCGKTTFLRCLTGFLRPATGTIRLFGKQPGDVSLGIPGVRLGYMPQEISLDNDFSIREAVHYYARLYRVPQDRAEENLSDLIRNLGLPPATRLIGSLSGGQKRRVSFVCSLIHEPRLVILDEPTVGCDPIVRENMWKIIFKMVKEKGTTVIITTHYVEEARRTDLIGFMRKGEVIAQESPETILKHYGVSSLEETFAILCREKVNPFKPMIHMVKDVSSSPLSAISDYHLSHRPSTSSDNSYEIDQYRSSSHDSSDNHNSKFRSFLSSISGKQLEIQLYLFYAVFSRVFLRFCKLRWYIIGASGIIAYLVFLYASIYGVTPKHMKIGVFNEENPPHLTQIVIDLINRDIIKLVPYTDMESAYKAAEAKQIHGFIHFPKRFSYYAPLKYYFREPPETEKLDYIRGSRVHFVGDAYEKIGYQIVELCLTRAIRTAGPLMMANASMNPALAVWPITESEPIYDLVDPNDATGSKTFFMPVAIFYIGHVTCFLLSIYSLIRDRKDSVLERTYAAGAGPTHILLSHFITNSMIPLLTCGPLWYIALYHLDAPCRGSFVLLLTFYFINILSAIPVSFLFAILKFDQMFTFMLAVAYCMVGLATCGILWPIEGLPYFMRTFKYFFPYPEVIRGAIRIMVKGCTLSDAIVQNSLIHVFGFYTCTTILTRIVF